MSRSKAQYMVNKPLKADVIYNSSCLDMKEIPDQSIQLLITSPPYNVNMPYEQALSFEVYKEFALKWLKEAWRVLVTGGRLCVVVANTNRKPFAPLPSYYSVWGHELGFLHRGEITWEKIGRSGDSTAWGSWLSPSNPFLRDTTESILFFLRYDPVVYEIIERIHSKINVFSKLEYKLKSDEKVILDKKDFMRNTISLYKSEDDEENHTHWKIRCETNIKWHPAPFPLELVQRLIRLYSFPGNYVLDMFSGSGTLAVACLREKRRFIGYETDEEYYTLSLMRIEEERKLILREKNTLKLDKFLPQTEKQNKLF